ncbi:MAG: LysR family transcriptional regulator [Nitratireductor sp.]
MSDIDIRLLNVFTSVVECRGFTNAQAVLNVGQSTISSHIAELEQRLGFRLCDRGRSGFRLTHKGERVYALTLKLFKAHEQFQNATMELKGTLSGFLKVGIIDSTITDPNCPMVRGIELLNNKASEISIHLVVLPPNELQRAILEGNIDAGVGTFDNHMSELAYKPIYQEYNTLYCARSHEIARLTAPADIRAAIVKSRKVTRSYLEGGDLFPLGEKTDTMHASVEFLEAAAMLLLAGGHIGFLPRHYASMWVKSGQLVPVLEDELFYTSDFYVVSRKKPRESTILRTFLADLDHAMNQIEAGQGIVDSNIGAQPT